MNFVDSKYRLIIAPIFLLGLLMGFIGNPTDGFSTEDLPNEVNLPLINVSIDTALLKQTKTMDRQAIVELLRQNGVSVVVVAGDGDGNNIVTSLPLTTDVKVAQFYEENRITFLNGGSGSERSGAVFIPPYAYVKSLFDNGENNERPLFDQPLILLTETSTKEMIQHELVHCLVWYGRSPEPVLFEGQRLDTRGAIVAEMDRLSENNDDQDTAHSRYQFLELQRLKEFEGEECDVALFILDHYRALGYQSTNDLEANKATLILNADLAGEVLQTMPAKGADLAAIKRQFVEEFAPYQIKANVMVLSYAMSREFESFSSTAADKLVVRYTYLAKNMDAGDEFEVLQDQFCQAVADDIIEGEPFGISVLFALERASNIGNQPLKFMPHEIKDETLEKIVTSMGDEATEIFKEMLATGTAMCTERCTVAARSLTFLGRSGFEVLFNALGDSKRSVKFRAALGGMSYMAKDFGDIYGHQIVERREYDLEIAKYLSMLIPASETTIEKSKPSMLQGYKLAAGYFVKSFLGQSAEIYLTYGSENEDAALIYIEGELRKIVDTFPNLSRKISTEIPKTYQPSHTVHENAARKSKALVKIGAHLRIRGII